MRSRTWEVEDWREKGFEEGLGEVLMEWFLEKAVEQEEEAPATTAEDMVESLETTKLREVEGKT